MNKSSSLCSHRSVWLMFLALGLACFTVLQLALFPVFRTELALGYSLYIIILWRYPASWLVILPALLPVLDLAPWSGRYLWNEFDHLIILTLAVALWRGHLALNFPQQSGPLKRLVLAMAGVQLLMLVNGAFPWMPNDKGFLTAYLDSSAALRNSKGFVESVLLLPLLFYAKKNAVPVYQKMGLGLLLGLCLCILSVLWERAVLIGLFDYSAQYRATGFFSGMHIGGAFLDAYLALSLPFFALCFYWSKHNLLRLAGLLLFAAALYTFVITFSRANYLALLAMLTLLVMSPRILRGQSPLALSKKTIWGLVGFSLLVILPIFFGAFSQQRLSQVSQDMLTRLSHWQTAVHVMDQGVSSVLAGEGKGRFPRYYRERTKEGSALSSAELQQEEGNQYLRFSKSDSAGDLYVRQRFDNAAGSPYQIRLKLRKWTDAPEKLLIEFCEQNILQAAPECQWAGIKIDRAAAGVWATYNSDIDVSHTLSSRLWWARPIEISLMNRGLSAPIDIDDVELISAGGINLLSNSDFSNDSDNWFTSAGNHLSWHVKNIWVASYFEGGVLAFVALLVLLVLVLKRLKNSLQQGSRVSLLLLTGFCGFLIIGLFDNIFDDPRIVLLFYLLCWLSFMQPEKEQRVGEHDLPWGKLIGSTLLGSGALLGGLFFYLMSSYQLSAQQLISKGMDLTGDRLFSLQAQKSRIFGSVSGDQFRLAETIAQWQQNRQVDIFNKAGVIYEKRTVMVDDEKALYSAINNALPGDLILLAPGTFRLQGKYVGISRPGEPDFPIVVAASAPWETRIEMDMLEGFLVDAPYWQFRGLVIEGVCGTHDRCEHAFHIVGNGQHTALYGNRISGFNAHIKGNGTRGNWPDHVIIEGNSFTNPSPRKTANPVTLLDVVAASHWRVSDNLIANFKKEGNNKTSYGAYFKGAGQQNSFKNNLVICSEDVSGAFIQVGLSFGGGGTAMSVCRDNKCSVEHSQGTLMGNLVANCSDVGIYLNKSAQTLVANNTLYQTLGIDVRFAQTEALIANNLLSGRIKERDGGVVQLQSNNWIQPINAVLGDSFETFFIAPNLLDFRLAADLSTVPPAAKNEAQGQDLCGNAYIPAQPYIGAIDYQQQADCVANGR